MLALLSSPRPEMTDEDFAVWLQLCSDISVARRISRRRPRPATLPEAWAYRPDHPAPIVTEAGSRAQEGRSRWLQGLRSLSSGRTVEFSDSGLVDEYGEPYAYPLGSEVEMGAYRALERERNVVSAKYVQGHRFSCSPFGSEETRFRNMSTEPYFADICGTFHHRTGDKIVWNNYRLA